jgi:hypothetical protein
MDRFLSNVIGVVTLGWVVVVVWFGREVCR